MSARSQATPERPWLGLSRFSESDRDYFYGRDTEIAEMRDRVLRAPLTVLYGVSGYGKSSLLGAGLIPELRLEGLLPIALPRFVFGDPTRPLLTQALRVIRAALPSLDSNTPAALPQSLWEFFHDRSLPWWQSNHPCYTQPVLLFDQFEDFFTQGEDKGGECATGAREFLTAVADLIENRAPTALRERLKSDRTLTRAYDFQSRPVKVVLALREDFLARLERWRRILPSMVDNRLELRLLRGPQALRAVFEPGRKRADHPPIMDEATAVAIVRFVAGVQDEVPLEEIDNVPPLLSVICAHLNERRFTAPFDALAQRNDLPMEWVRAPHPSGDASAQSRSAAERGLERFYNRSFARYPEAVRYFVEDSLVSEAGFRETVTRATALAKLSADAVPDPNGALLRLVDDRLLIIEDRGGISRVELTHDILATLALRNRRERKQREEAARKSRELAATRRSARIRAAFMTLLILLAAAAGTGGWIGFREAAAARASDFRKQAADVRNQAADARNRELLHQASMADYAVAVQRIGTDNRWSEGVAHLVRALEWEPKNYLAAAWLYTTIALNAPKRAVIVRLELLHKEGVTTASFSPDGAKILTISRDRTARLWDAFSGKPLTEPLSHLNTISSASFSPDGSKIVTASADNIARIWETSSGTPHSKVLLHNGSVITASFSPNGSKIVTASADKTARIWDSTSGKPLSEPLKHDDAVWSASFSPDGLKIVTASADKTARIWDSTSGKPLLGPLQHSDLVFNATFSLDGSKIVTISADNTARLWDTFSGNLLVTLPQHSETISSASFSPDGAKIVTASANKTARIWNVASGRPLSEPLLHNNSVISASFSPDGSTIITASADKTARIWDAYSGKPLSEPLQHSDTVYSASFSPDGSKILTASADRSARIWDASLCEPLSAPFRHADTAWSAAFSPDGSKVVTASADKTARVWDAASGKPLLKPFLHNGSVMSASFSPDGSKIVTASEDKTARIWDASSGKPLSDPLKHGGTVWSANFSPDGSKIVTASDDKTARIWDASTGQILLAPLKHGNTVWNASFSPDGSKIVTASEDRTARIWEVSSGRLLLKPLKHDDTVWNASFSPDGSKVVTSSADKTARIWDISSGKPLLRPLQHSDVVYSASFNAKGSQIVTASADKTARIWDTVSGRLLSEPLKHDDAVHSATFSLDGSKIITTSGSIARIWYGSGNIDSAVPVPAWGSQWAQAIGGWCFDQDGTMQALDSTDRIKLLSAHREGNDPWARLASWLATEPGKRTTHPDSPRTLRQVAECERDFDTRESLNCALRYDPTVPLARLLLARFEESPERAAFLRNYDLQCLPDDAELWARASRSLVDQKQPKAALSAAEKAALLSPELPAALRALAMAFKNIEQKNDALATYEKLLLLKDAAGSDFAEAGYLAATLTKDKRAREIFQLAEETFPLDSEIVRKKAWALLNLNAPAEALAVFTALKTDDGRPANTLIGLAISHWLIGDHDQAVAEYQELIGLKKQYADLKFIQTLDWPDTEKKPLISIIKETLRRHPGLKAE